MEGNRNSPEEMREEFLRICPAAINRLRQLIDSPATPVMAKVALIGMVLDRALGKPEASVKVSTDGGRFEEAEARLMAIVKEIQIEEGFLVEGEGEVIDEREDQEPDETPGEDRAGGGV